MPKSEVFMGDCVEYMRGLPDEFFDLAICDPPYGEALCHDDGFTPPPARCGNGRTTAGSEVASTSSNETMEERKHTLRRVFQPIQTNQGQPMHGADASRGTQLSPRKSTKIHTAGGTWSRRYAPFCECRTDDEETKVKYGTIDWDVAPPQEYWDELFRVSKNQIVWGGNYFWLPPTRCFVVWRKLSIGEKFSMAMAEYAWTSFNRNALVYEAVPQRGAMSGKFHPTEKPVGLYQFLLRNFAKEGDKIFDPNMGSQNSRIAAYGMGFDYWGTEICGEYFEKGCANFERVCMGRRTLGDGRTIMEGRLF